MYSLEEKVGYYLLKKAGEERPARWRCLSPTWHAEVSMWLPLDLRQLQNVSGEFLARLSRKGSSNLP